VPAIGPHLFHPSCMIIHDWSSIQSNMIMGAEKYLAGGAGALFVTLSHTPNFSKTKLSFRLVKAKHPFARTKFF
jgi:hypothetical protein